MAATATGRFSRLEDAIESYVRYVDEVPPDPAWVETYARMQPTFDKLYIHSQTLYDDLDALTKGAIQARPDQD
jgi:xylulokinase